MGSGEHAAAAGDRYPHPRVVGLLLPLLRGRFRKTMVRSLRGIKKEAEAKRRRHDPLGRTFRA
jgi:hypothetical protein